jgi:hypothetical protein
MTFVQHVLEELWHGEWPARPTTGIQTAFDLIDALGAAEILGHSDTNAWRERVRRLTLGHAQYPAPKAVLRARVMAVLRPLAHTGERDLLANSLAEMNLISADDAIAVAPSLAAGHGSLADEDPDWAAVQAVAAGPDLDHLGLRVVWIARFSAGLMLGLRCHDNVVSPDELLLRDDSGTLHTPSGGYAGGQLGLPRMYFDVPAFPFFDLIYRGGILNLSTPVA